MNQISSALGIPHDSIRSDYALTAKRRAIPAMPRSQVASVLSIGMILVGSRSLALRP